MADNSQVTASPSSSGQDNPGFSVEEEVEHNSKKWWKGWKGKHTGESSTDEEDGGSKPVKTCGPRQIIASIVVPLVFCGVILLVYYTVDFDDQPRLLDNTIDQEKGDQVHDDAPNENAPDDDKVSVKLTTKLQEILQTTVAEEETTTIIDKVMTTDEYMQTTHLKTALEIEAATTKPRDVQMMTTEGKVKETSVQNPSTQNVDQNSKITTVAKDNEHVTDTSTVSMTRVHDSSEVSTPSVTTNT